MLTNELAFLYGSHGESVKELGPKMTQKSSHPFLIFPSGKE